MDRMSDSLHVVSDEGLLGWAADRETVSLTVSYNVATSAGIHGGARNPPILAKAVPTRRQRGSPRHGFDTWARYQLVSSSVLINGQLA